MSIENLFVEDIQDSYLEKGELMSKVSLFFGAGAEIGYGLPSGGKFALDIFRMDVAEDKKRLREAREKVNKRSNYAKNWLPQDYEKKPISSFGRTQYESLGLCCVIQTRNQTS
ncbi:MULTISPECIES: hypothetical protein [unclassified Vibrio]|uniref:hypothetical protein n=1 Tax=unclassified Vibrio TaxID=2614977 RepID=UPI0021CE19F9|nr:MULTISPECIES: hypothetical protein [unclassified Vibrio]MDW1604982.1 hypothetical protein [Vibrio sp. Vb2977]MDW1667956.1 hypothetical protein [Vibrio sp. Vb2978]MDW1681977.1 hypothetical protein [Vibrio sp. Vb2942]